VADANGIFLVKDNCESLGAKLDGNMAGNFGDVGTFSFFFSHHISTMEGGVSVTNSLELPKVMTSLLPTAGRELPAPNLVLDKSGNDFDDLFRFVLPGDHLRQLKLEGAIGSEQPKKVADVVSEFPRVLTQTEVGESSWFGFSLILTKQFAEVRAKLVEIFSNYGIASRPISAGNFTRN
jgi:CDP-6-deoxy-D-xylo-4-hexulose-3-dehydrase